MSVESTLDDASTWPTTDGKAIFPECSQSQLAWKDLREGTAKWRIWLMLAWQDIKLRYRRSVLGPFWITLSMAITVYSMGYLYSHLFHTDILTYFPFVVGGMLAWSLISTTTIDLVEIFTQSERMIKQIKLPYSLYVYRTVTRNMLIFLHNILVIVPIYIFFHQTVKINFNTLLFIPDLFFIYINAFSYGMILAMLGGRYRDIGQMVKSLIQVIFFLTPVMWSPSLLPANKVFIIVLNPFYSFVELLRAPLLGTTPTAVNYIMVFSVTVIGAGIAFKMFCRYRARIVYWL